MSLPLVIVAAVGRNRVIGRDNGLAWRLPSDLRHFKALTLGKPLIMGRRTFASIGRPLPGRETIVLTRDIKFAAPGTAVAHDLAGALELAAAAARRLGADAIIIAGGGDVYAQTIARAERLHLTEVDLAPAGDILFPPIDAADWVESSREKPLRAAGDEADFDFTVYKRR